MSNVASVAAHIIERLGGGVDAIKLQKLVYYSQGWHIATRGQELFPEPVKAYRHGPVVGALWHMHQGRHRVTMPQLRHAELAPLSETEAEVVDAVVDAYGKMRPWALVHQTHRERPWIDAWANDYDDRITPEAMSRYFAFVSAVPSAASGKLPNIKSRLVTYALGTDLEALGDLDTPDDVSGLVAAVTQARG